MGFDLLIFVSKRLQVLVLAGFCLMLGQLVHQVKAADAMTRTGVHAHTKTASLNASATRVRVAITRD